MAALSAAAALAVLHMVFLVYMTVGGFLALYRFPLIWPSLGVTVYSIYVTLTDFTCPVTTLEKWFLQLGGRTPYEGSFTAHYLRGTLYPPEYETAIWMSAMALAVSSYVLVLVRQRRDHRARDVVALGDPGRVAASRVVVPMSAPGDENG